MPLIRDAGPGAIRAAPSACSACIAADAGCLPSPEAGDEPTVLAWFLLKPLLACLMAEQDGLVAGVAGLRDAAPGPGEGRPADAGWSMPPGRPPSAGGRGHRDLIGARASRRDDSWIEVFEAETGLVAIVQASGPAYRDVLSRALG